MQVGTPPFDMRYYYTERGLVKSGRSYHYVVKRGKRYHSVVFYASSRKLADRYALDWGKERGYRVFRKTKRTIKRH